jgi:spore germination protein KC
MSLSIRRTAALISIVFCTITLSGCWNYREVERLGIVSGAAIDKQGEDKLLVTVEIVSPDQSQQQPSLKPVYVQLVGDTLFEIVRSMVSLQGRRLYWSHAKAIVISEAVARDGLDKVLDFMNRDAELRGDMWVLISKEKTANEIFRTQFSMENIVAYELDYTLRAQKSIGLFPSVELYELIDNLASEEASPVLPVVDLYNFRGTSASHIGGAAIIKDNKLQGYLDEIDTRSMLWVQDELKGGVYPLKASDGTKVSLEIIESRTKVKPEIIDNELVIKLNLLVEVSIGEIMGQKDFISEEGRIALQKDAEEKIKKDLEKLIEKAQKEYKTDFLRFGEKIKRTMPRVWKSIEKDWTDIFPDVSTKIEVAVRIKSSATSMKPLKVGK